MRRYLFVFLEIMFYIIFLYCDIVKKQYNISNLIKFISIVLCFSYLIYDTRYKRKKSFVVYAMALTVVADLCLLLWDQDILGVLCFICVQYCYLFWMVKEKWISSLKLILMGRLILTGFVLCLLSYFHIKIDILLCSCVLYFICIVWNVGISIYHRKKNTLFMIGMLLFLICDIQVGCYNVDRYILMDQDAISFRWLFDWIAIGMWLFYLPSQVCIVLSMSKEEYDM